MRNTTNHEMKAIKNMKGRVTNNLLYNEYEIEKLAHLVEDKKANNYSCCREVGTKTLIYVVEKHTNKTNGTYTITRKCYTLEGATKPTSRKDKKANKNQPSNTGIDIEAISKIVAQVLQAQKQ